MDLQKHLFLPVSAALIYVTSGAALALDPPGGAEISSSLAAELPAYWSVRSVEVTASVNDGDDATPSYRQRFVADAIPNEDLYLALSDDGEIGPFASLIKTHAASQTRKIYGVATSVVSLGKWSTKLSLENSVHGVGRPRSLYAGPVVIAGAEQTGEIAQGFIKLLDISKTVTEGIARRTVSSEALKKLATEEQAALVQANRQRLAALEEKYRQEMVAFMGNAERDRQQLEAANKVRLARVKAELEEEIAALERRKAAIDQERKLRVEESQRMLDELAQKFREEREAFAGAAERERQQYLAANHKRLTTLKAEIQQETTNLNEKTAALDNERKLLVAENLKKIDALQAQYERKRAEITAVAKTLDTIVSVEAEAEAQKKLAAAQATLAEEMKRAIEATQQTESIAIEEKKKRYRALVAALQSKNIAERNATFDSILEADDENLKKIAIAEAMKSGDDGLQAKALAALIVRQPRIGITITFESGKQNRTSQQFLEITKIDERKLTFSGRFQPSSQNICVLGSERYKPVYAPKGSGSVQRDRLTLTGYWYRAALTHNPACYKPSQYSCTTTVQVNEKGVLAGVTTCGEHHYTAEVNL